MTGQISASGAEPPRPDPDAELLRALANGSQTDRSQALAQLMDRHLKAIKSMAWHMMGDEMTAEDIAQETFLKAWKHAPNWQPGKAKFSTWLYRVAKNLCYDRLRKKREVYSDTLPEMVDAAPLAAQMMIYEENNTAQKQAVQEALQQLPERQLTAVTLCHYQNMSQIEAAAIMEVGIRAYESLLARGRRNLRDYLSARKTELMGQMGETL
jgi:RNA polymerase sigma-70 factor (ECF subfamily)